jgi:aerobic-type carbon monoxide dehydrogenase small subunit (CoxS/CutS family)
VLRPRLEELTLRVRVDGVTHTVTAWSDMSALEALRTVLPSAPSKCEAGICGTCAVLLDGVVERVCSLPAHRLDGASVETGRR